MSQEYEIPRVDRSGLESPKVQDTNHVMNINNNYNINNIYLNND
jgi:hypothetical protein